MAVGRNSIGMEILQSLPIQANFARYAPQWVSPKWGVGRKFYDIIRSQKFSTCFVRISDEGLKRPM